MTWVTPFLPSSSPTPLATWLRRLQLTARRALEGGAGGQFASLFRGAGITFEELREYQPGDDIRVIEWKATARLGHPFVKRFIEERELTVVLAIDQSGSMMFGGNTRSKWQTAVECGALLGLLAAYNRNRVGLALFDTQVRQFYPPQRGLRQALRRIARLLHHQPHREPTSISQVGTLVLRLLRRRSLVIMISDFLDNDYGASLARLASKHELILIRVADPAEKQLPAKGLLWLEDCETGQRIFVDAAQRRVRRVWSQVSSEFNEQFRRVSESSHIDAWEVSTNDDILEALRSWLLKRKRRLRHN